MDSSEKLKILTLGNSDVGKTCFILRYVENRFEIDHISSSGIDLRTKIITLSNNKKYRVDIYDTAGQERYKSISYNLIRNVDGIILMYSINKQTTYDSIAEWMKNILNIKKEGFPIVLLGNKCDLEDERKISEEEGKKLASQYNISFYETSNKDGKNIEAACSDLINKIIEYKEKEEKEKKKENGKNENKNIVLDKKTNKSFIKKICPCQK